MANPGAAHGSNQTTRQFVHGTQYITAGGESDQDRRYFYHQDRNWNVVAISEYADGVGTDGQIVERYAYTPYGPACLYSDWVAGEKGR